MMLKSFVKASFIRSVSPSRPLEQVATFAISREPRQNSKNLLHAPQNIRTSWLKNVVRDMLPFTTQTISARGQSVDDLEIAASYCTPLPAQKENEHDMLGKKRTDDSWLELYFPFSAHPSLQHKMSKSDGVNMRYGKLFEILDALAADVAYRHCGWGDNPDLTVVTAGVDGLTVHSDISLSNDLKLHGYLTYVGRSSLEVTIDMISVLPSTGEETLIGHTEFIMVARYLSIIPIWFTV